MNTYTIAKAPRPVCWESVPALAVENIHWCPDAGARMKAQICYDERALYLHLTAKEENIRAEHTTPGCMVCEDSCMEFFFRPEADDSRYFNFEMNLNAQMYIGIGTDRHDSVHLLPHDESSLFQAEAHTTDSGWELCYRIPASFIRLFFPAFKLESGKKLYANCYKCGDLTVKPHFMAWNPVTSETPDFHRTCDFGLMILA